MLKHSFNDVTLKNIGRWWLIGMLLFIPFQHRIFTIINPWNTKLAAFLNRLDELTIVIFLPLAIKEFFENKKIVKIDLQLYFILSFPILLLGISGLISGVINRNSLFITIFGTFDYVKYFLVIFVYAAFFRDFEEFKRIFRVLLMIAVVLGLIAFVEEFWAVFSRYILNKEITAKEIYLLGSAPTDAAYDTIDNIWRFGIYRASSLLSHYNLLGLYSLLFLTIYLCMTKKINPLIFFSLFMGIFASVSMTAYTGFLFLIGLKILKGRRWLVGIMVVLFVTLFIYMSTLNGFDTLDNVSTLTLREKWNNLSDNISFRKLAFAKAIEVWKDHPVWGVGPGMFGGPVALKYKTRVYEEYNFFLILREVYSLDQFWPQILAEMGIVGTIVFTELLISLLIVFLILRQRVISDEMRGLYKGLAAFTVIFFFYTFGGNLNNVSLLYPYLALAGMGLGGISITNAKSNITT